MAPAAAKQSGGTKPRRKRARKTRTAVVSDDSSSASSSSSSSSSSSDGNDELSREGRTRRTAVPLGKTAGGESDDSSEEGSSGESTESDDSSDESMSNGDVQSSGSKKAQTQGMDVDDTKSARRRFAQSPPPEITASFPDAGSKYAEELSKRVNLETICREMRPALPPLKLTLFEAARQKRREAIALKEERKLAFEEKQKQTIGDSATREDDFKALWMRMMVDEFGEELNAIRKKEPTLSTEGANSRMPLLIDALSAGSELFSRGSSSYSKGTNTKMGEIDEVGLMLWHGRQKSKNEAQE